VISLSITGVFFHELFSQKVWHIINDKFRNFPGVMEDELKLSNVELFKPKKVSNELLLKVHTQSFLNDLQMQWYCEGAYFTIGGCVEASEMIMQGKLKNALAFGVAAGHHAERDYAWGGTYASVCGPIVANLQYKYPGTRIAILDTDSHHGNGTRDVTLGNPDVLHVCFCSSNRIEDEGTKICVNSGFNTTDDEYLNLVEREFLGRLNDFEPDIIVHLLGHDTARGDYGDRGLTVEFFSRLVEMVKDASKICNERYFINTHGGAVVVICEEVYTHAIRILSKE
jgi:acetoin utilization deacetylase AcuC-like enzyme